MSATNGNGRILAVGDELPPMASRSAEHNGKAKGTPKRKAGERFAVLNTFVDFTAGALPRSELLVWLTLYRDARDGIARTAQADIARRSGLGRRTVGIAVANLAKRGLLDVVRRGGLNRGPASYRLQGVPP